MRFARAREPLVDLYLRKALFRDRQALVFTATFNLRAFALSPGDTVMLTLARYGWTAKVFRVLERR